MIIKVNKLGDYELLGDTRDDAVGEAFDKVAKLLNLVIQEDQFLRKLLCKEIAHLFLSTTDGSL